MFLILCPLIISYFFTNIDTLLYNEKAEERITTHRAWKETHWLIPGLCPQRLYGRHTSHFVTEGQAKFGWMCQEPRLNFATDLEGSWVDIPYPF